MNWRRRRGFGEHHGTHSNQHGGRALGVPCVRGVNRICAALGFERTVAALAAGRARGRKGPCSGLHAEKVAAIQALAVSGRSAAKACKVLGIRAQHALQVRPRINIKIFLNYSTSHKESRHRPHCAGRNKNYDFTR